MVSDFSSGILSVRNEVSVNMDLAENSLIFQCVHKLHLNPTNPIIHASRRIVECVCHRCKPVDFLAFIPSSNNFPKASAPFLCNRRKGHLPVIGMSPQLAQTLLPTREEEIHLSCVFLQQACMQVCCAPTKWYQVAADSCSSSACLYHPCTKLLCTQCAITSREASNNNCQRPETP